MSLWRSRSKCYGLNIRCYPNSYVLHTKSLAGYITIGVVEVLGYSFADKYRYNWVLYMSFILHRSLVNLIIIIVSSFSPSIYMYG